MGRCGGMLGGGGARGSRSFFGKKRSGLKIGNKSGHTFPVAFLDDFQEFGRFSAIFIFYFRLSIPGNGAENGCFSYVDFVSFCEIQSNHALPRGGGICGNAHMRKTRFAR